MESTNQLVTGDKITPGGFYTGVWCRDASYILNELVEMGRNEAAGRWLLGISVVWIPLAWSRMARASPPNPLPITAARARFISRLV